MGRLNITQDDINRTKILEPAWYPVEIVSAEDKPSKGDGSMNTTIEMKVLDGPFKGAILYRLFNEKAPGFAIPFMKALGFTIDGPVQFEMTTEALAGRQLMVFVKNQLYEGQVRNSVEDYRPIAA